MLIKPIGLLRADAAVAGSASKAAAADVFLTCSTSSDRPAAITVELDLIVPSGAATVSNLYFRYGASMLIGVRPSDGQLQVQSENGNGGPLFSKYPWDAPATTLIPVGTRTTILFSVTQDRGDTLAEGGLYVDGASVWSPAAKDSGSVTKTFLPDTTGATVLEGAAEVEIFSFKKWHAYSSDGTTGGLGTPIHSVAGSEVNWNTPNDTGSRGGIVKSGVDSFT